MKNIYISGFADEISPDFEEQLKTVTVLGMQHISLRSANLKNIADFTISEVKEELLPMLEKYSVAVSSLGSPIGKVDISDEAAYQKQLVQLSTLCEISVLLKCKFIRIFSFYIPCDKNPDDYCDTVKEKIQGFVNIAQKYNIILIHENEKEIFGDIGRRCHKLIKEINSPNLKAVFDFANFVQCKENPTECWDLLQDEIVYIHIKDAAYNSGHNVLCGTGDGQIPQLLQRAIVDEGYQGFLTLEPHLVLFGSLQSLEKQDASKVITENLAKDGADGYGIQYRALQDILKSIQ